MLVQTRLYPQFIAERRPPSLRLPVVAALVVVTAAPVLLALSGAPEVVTLQVLAVVNTAVGLHLLTVAGRAALLRDGCRAGRLTVWRVAVLALLCSAVVLALTFWSGCPTTGGGCVVTVDPPSVVQVAVTGSQVLIEESLFRVVLPLMLAASVGRLWVTDRWRVGVAVALFTLWHFPVTLAAALDHAAFGLLMVVVYTRSRSVAAPLVFHLVNNLVAAAVRVGGEGAPVEPGLGFMAAKYLSWTALLLLLDPRLRKPLLAWVSFTAPPGETGRAAPAQPTSRLQLVDALRGGALLLVVCENALLFLPGETVPGAYTRAEAVVRAGFGLLLEYRGLGLFTILLGFSLAASRSRGNAAVQSTRARALIFVGLCQGALLFPFDILVTFGLVILLLLRFGVSDGRVRGRWWVLAVLSLLGAQAAAGWIAGVPVDTDLDQFVFAASSSVATDLRALEWAASLVALPLSVAPALLPATLGYALGARYFAGQPVWSRSRSTLVVAVGLSLVLTLPHGLLLLAEGGSSSAIVSHVGAELCAALGSIGGAVSLLLLALTAGRDLDRRPSDLLVMALRVLSPAGRNTLTGYLMSSALLVALLPPYTADLARRLSLGAVLAVLLAAWCGYVGVSWIFFRHRRMAVERFTGWVAQRAADRPERFLVSVDGARPEGQEPSHQRDAHPQRERREVGTATAAR